MATSIRIAILGGILFAMKPIMMRVKPKNAKMASDTVRKGPKLSGLMRKAISSVFHPMATSF